MRALSILIVIVLALVGGGVAATLAGRDVQDDDPKAQPAETDWPAGVTEVIVTATVPEGAPTVYLTGDLPALGPWDPAALAMQGVGATRTARVAVPHGATLQFKITAGSWAREGVGPSGTVLPNFTVDAGEKRTVETTVAITDFKKDPEVYLNDPAGAGVEGQLITWFDVTSPRLSEARHVTVWLPPHYADNPDARFRVLYMHDGQNLFDPRIANTGVDWGADEAMLALARAGVIDTPAIVVGVWSTSLRRLEYAPGDLIAALDDDLESEVLAEFGGDILSDAYLAFLVEELKPRIDAAFRTRPEREATLIAGSSMAGLISLAALSAYPDVFAGAACLSMHWPVAINQERIFEDAQAWRATLLPAYERFIVEGGLDPARQRLWMDRGDLTLDALYEPYQDALVPVFEGAGFTDPARFQARVYPGTEHTEAAWRARLEEVFAFLLAQE